MIRLEKRWSFDLSFHLDISPYLACLATSFKPQVDINSVHLSLLFRVYFASPSFCSESSVLHTCELPQVEDWSYKKQRVQRQTSMMNLQPRSTIGSSFHSKCLRIEIIVTRPEGPTDAYLSTPG